MDGTPSSVRATRPLRTVWEWDGRRKKKAKRYTHENYPQPIYTRRQQQQKNATCLHSQPTNGSSRGTAHAALVKTRGPRTGRDSRARKKEKTERPRQKVRAGWGGAPQTRWSQRGARKPAHTSPSKTTPSWQGQHCAVRGLPRVQPWRTPTSQLPSNGDTSQVSLLVRRITSTHRPKKTSSTPPRRPGISKTEAATASASPQSPPATPTTINPKHTANPLGRDSYTAAAAPSGTPATAAGTGSTGRRVSWKITASWTNSNRSGSPARISVAPRATTRGKPDDGSVIW